jgi:small-conductance mechanosensitive channel
MSTELIEQVMPWIVSLIIIIGSLILSVIFHKWLFKLLLKIASNTDTELDDALLKSLRLPFSGLIALGGIYAGLTYSINLFPQTLMSLSLRGLLNKSISVFLILFLILVFSRLMFNAFDWYAESLKGNRRTSVNSKLIPICRRASVIIIYIIGTLLIFDTLGINISPLIAGLGLSGLAVALAIQPTLSDLFAGTYVITEGSVTSGDYIELDNGISGYVVAVGWRSTKVRTVMNNLVIVPNSKFAETVITNYNEPRSSLNVIVECGVSYDSDLDQVEQVCKKIMTELVDENDSAVKEFGSYFAFESFGESNIDFWMFIQAKDRIASFNLKSELIKRIHSEFHDSGIVINYPVRSLQIDPNVVLSEIKPVLEDKDNNSL